jgi:hypothetical protein
VAKFIHEQITDLDSQNADEEEPKDVTPVENSKCYIGSCQLAVTLAELEDMHKSESTFDHFRLHLSSFLTSFFQSHDIPLPNGRAIQLAASEKVSVHYLLQPLISVNNSKLDH